MKLDRFQLEEFDTHYGNTLVLDNEKNLCMVRGIRGGTHARVDKYVNGAGMAVDIPLDSISRFTPACGFINLRNKAVVVSRIPAARQKRGVCTDNTQLFQPSIKEKSLELDIKPTDMGMLIEIWSTPPKLVSFALHMKTKDSSLALSNHYAVLSYSPPAERREEVVYGTRKRNILVGQGGILGEVEYLGDATVLVTLGRANKYIKDSVHEAFKASITEEVQVRA